jgi:phosphoserine phosphatase
LLPPHHSRDESQPCQGVDERNTGKMTSHRSQSLIAALIVSIGAWLTAGAIGQDPLPSWNDTAAKRAIAGFVDRVVKNGGPDYVAPAERIAVFDNDGTLWCEQPMYVQLAFALDRVKALASQHPDWKTTEPFASILKGDLKSALGDEKTVLEMMAVTHTGMTTDEFTRIATDWIATARHPKTNRLYTEMVYQPMLELLTYLRANGFKTFVVSGGGIDFMRPWTEKTYGIPPEQVLGSAAKTTFEMRDGKPVLLRQPAVDVIDDKQGKPINIHKVIGRRPILAFGNSDGDQQMLEWTAAGSGARFMGLVHHTDAAREFDYDRKSSIGRLDTALDEATSKKWTVVSMKDDWNRVFPQ